VCRFLDESRVKTPWDDIAAIAVDCYDSIHKPFPVYPAVTPDTGQHAERPRRRWRFPAFL